MNCEWVNEWAKDEWLKLWEKGWIDEVEEGWINEWMSYLFEGWMNIYAPCLL